MSFLEVFTVTDIEIIIYEDLLDMFDIQESNKKLYPIDPFMSHNTVRSLLKFNLKINDVSNERFSEGTNGYSSSVSLYLSISLLSSPFLSLLKRRNNETTDRDRYRTR